MARVAAESGAAKTTIYQRWPTKARGIIFAEDLLKIAGQ